VVTAIENAFLFLVNEIVLNPVLSTD